MNHYYRRVTTGMAIAVAFWTASPVHAQLPVVEVPFKSGVSIMHIRHMPPTDRESVIRLSEVTPKGVEMTWGLQDVSNGKDTARRSFSTYVSTEDLAHSTRLRDIFIPNEQREFPGYTRWTLSADVLNKLHAPGTAEYSILGALDGSMGSVFGGNPVLVRWRGTLSRVATEKFPLIVNDRRVAVPAVHAKGDFTARGKPWKMDIWILDDKRDPLILKVLDADGIFQTVRVDYVDVRALDGLLTKGCRAELPGVSFEFNSAALDPASDQAIAELASVLSKHSDWNVSIEGHTDNIGSDASNKLLSQRRAESVRSRLVSRYHIPASHVNTAGYGATRPKESNATVEGRARNRRVEIVRPCGST